MTGSPHRPGVGALLGVRGRHGPLPPLLLVLTLVAGLVDAFSYLALGHVFVSNMTGNVIFLAFSLAGAKGFSVAASLLALGGFGLGAVLGGRLGVLVARHRARLLLWGQVAQAVLAVAALGVAEAVRLPPSGGARAALVVLLAVAMGLQNAVVAGLAVPDLRTTVLTSTLTGLAADSRLAGGRDPRLARRLAGPVALFAGALLGTVLIRHGVADVPLRVAAGLMAAVAAVLVPLRGSSAPWTRRPG
ncbi:YoaK family protein [Actinacidiphila yeochonensis]|uniref:YoaK family protein n=1 Tax=Actinacidiphila yeochonensis TaxID=89050 RepID=UPI000689FB6B|nr:YoaK family protein [Actinacidiphila yeochonensis]